MAVINGYEVIGELKNDNSGFSKWGFAKKNNVEYFIKEFLSPIYPLDESVLSATQLEKKRNICYEFEREKRYFYNQLNKCSTGNVVTVADFFRYGSKFYIVTEKIDAAPIEPKDVSKLSLDQKMLIIKIILHGIYSLHKNDIVHGDIKPDNILFKRTATGNYTAKIIDFDSSFLEHLPPADGEELQGDTVYFAPESLLLIIEEDIKLTKKIDVFALGILFHQYFCGELPCFDKNKYNYPFESVLDGEELKIHSSIPVFMHEMLGKMIDKEPENRPSIEEVFAWVMNPGAKVTGVEKPATIGVPDIPAKPVVPLADRDKVRSVVSSSGLKSTMRCTRVDEREAEPVKREVHSSESVNNEYFRRADDF